MEYNLHNFTDGQVLHATPLNEMDVQILQNKTNLIAIEETELPQIKAGLSELDSRLSESLIEISEDVNRVMSKVSPLDIALTEIGYIYNDGRIMNEQNARHSDYVAIGSFKKLYVKTNLGNIARAIAFYDKDKKYLQDISISISGIEERTIDLTDPTYSDAKYIIVSLYNLSYLTTIYKAFLYSDGNINDTIKDMETEIDKLDVRVDDVEDTLEATRELIENVDYTLFNGYYDGNTKHFAESVSYYCAIVDLSTIGAIEALLITTVANSVAKEIIYFKGNPSSATQIGTDGHTYPDNWGFANFTDDIANIPKNATHACINYRNDKGHPFVIKAQGVSQRFANIEKNIEKINYDISKLDHYVGKRILFLGDSITALGTSDRGWVGKFNAIVKPSVFQNVAVAGAHWCDYENTVLDGNPVLGGADNNVNNTISNQVEKVSRSKDAHMVGFEDFDCIIIASGTNDTNSDDGLSTQFFANDTVVPYESLDRKTWSGAMRYAYERLKRMYPNAQFFYCSPIQGFENTRPYAQINMKRERIRNICDRISDVVFVDTFNCGICGVYELSNANGRDLIDGLHPNASGALKMGRYNANAFINFYNYNR